MQRSKTYFVKSLGCKANSADGQLLEAGLLERGMSSVAEPERADVIVVNSCTVTDEADRQSQKFVRDFRRKNPSAQIIYTGCAAEVDPHGALKIPGVSAVIGNQDKIRASEWIAGFQGADAPVILGGVTPYQELLSRHPMDREWPLPTTGIHDLLKLQESSPGFRTRAFIKIQEGCNSFCTYCIIPYGRGPNRSLRIEQIVSEVRILVENGIQEVILTGTNIGDYGLDWAGESSARPDGGLPIDDLIEAILSETALPRLRVSSLDPTEISGRLIALMEREPRFCPHFHVSLQHTSSKILRLMKRKYQHEDVVECLTRLGAMKHRPFVGMDFITGFPGETREDFEESKATLEGLYWSRLHVFPYSEREGTPATRLPASVPVPERKARARELQELSLERLQAHFSARRAAGSSAEVELPEVLMEGSVRGPDGTNEWIAGYTPHYERVLLPKTETVLRNRILNLRARHWIVDRAGGEVLWLGVTA